LVQRPNSHFDEGTQDLSRGIPGFPKNVLPFPSEYRFTILEGSIDQGAKDVTTCLDALDEFQWKWNQNMLTGHGFAMRNVWSRQARRRKKRGRLEEEPDEQEEIDEDEAALGIRVLLRQSKQEKSAEIVIRWLKGNDEVLFESFCGMLHRKLEKR
jgi:23S rRNA (adenine1618-N6)-methyltransferase